MEEQKQAEPKSKQELSKRLGSSALFVGAACWIIFFAPKILFILFATFFSIIALNEYLELAKKQYAFNQPLVLALGLLAPWAVAQGWLSFYIPLCIVSLFVSNMSPENLPKGLSAAAIALFGLVWICVSFSYVIELRYVTEGAQWVFYTMFVVKIGDAAAYFAGKKWGKNKFVPHISPKKTWEGAVAQWVGSVGASMFCATFLDAPLQTLFILGAILGVLSQVGDMIESIVKRSFSAKDSGAVPGLGGFLDVLDSVLVTVPFVYFYVTFFVY